MLDLRDKLACHNGQRKYMLGILENIGLLGSKPVEDLMDPSAKL